MREQLPDKLETLNIDVLSFRWIGSHPTKKTFLVKVLPEKSLRIPI